MGFLKISCIFVLCGVQSSPLVFAPNRAFVCGSLQGYDRLRERICVSGLRYPELSNQVRRENRSLATFVDTTENAHECTCTHIKSKC